MSTAPAELPEASRPSKGAKDIVRSEPGRFSARGLWGPAPGPSAVKMSGMNEFETDTGNEQQLQPQKREKQGGGSTKQHFIMAIPGNFGKLQPRTLLTAI